MSEKFVYYESESDRDTKIKENEALGFYLENDDFLAKDGSLAEKGKGRLRFKNDPIEVLTNSNFGGDQLAALNWLLKPHNMEVGSKT